MLSKHRGIFEDSQRTMPSMAAGSASPRAIPVRKVLKWCVLCEEPALRRTKARFLSPFATYEIIRMLIEVDHHMAPTKTRGERVLHLLQEPLYSLI